jgi:hypothetical protein
MKRHLRIALIIFGVTLGLSHDGQRPSDPLAERDTSLRISPKESAQMRSGS